MQPLQTEERYTLSKLMSEQLKTYILERRLRPGDKLPSERDLVQVYQVSRSILRESLRILEAEGVVQIRHGEGAFVREFDLAPLIEQLHYQWLRGAGDPAELFALIGALESIIAGSTPGPDAGIVSRLREAAARMSEPSRLPAAWLDFHLALASSSRNGLLAQIAGALLRHAASLQPFASRSVPAWREAHAALADALERQDAARCAALVAELWSRPASK